MNLEGHDYIGSLEFSIHEVVRGRDGMLVKPLVNDARGGGKSGTIKITGEERVVGSKEEVNMTMRATFPDMRGFNFFLLHKLVNGKTWKPIYKSEIQPVAEGAYTWLPMNLLSSDMAGDDVDREIRIDFFNS